MMIKIFAKSRKGLTFIELLLVVSIIAIVGTAGVLSFRSGRNTWGNADNQTQVIQNAVVGMEKVVREIKNSPGIVYFDSAINGTKMRLKVLRNDGSGTYVEQYAMFKRDGNYLQYGERATDSATEADWTLNNLAYPVTNLSFSFLNADGAAAATAEDVKSVQISMMTEDAGVTIPLKSNAYLVVNSQGTASEESFDGTDDDGSDGHFDEVNDDEPTTEGDGVPGCSISDYAVYGDREVSISNSCTINGNVGSRCLSGSAYNSQNSTVINGYLVVKGTLNMSNSGAVCGNSVVAACVTPSSYNSNFANSARANGNYWTLKNITMSNSSWIHGKVYQPAAPGATITCHNQSGYDEKVDLDTTEVKVDGKYQFILDPLDPENAGMDPKKSLFPILPPIENFTLSWGTIDKSYWNQSDQTLGPGDYRNLSVGKSTVTLSPDSKFRNADVNNGSILNIASGNTFNSLSVSNSSQINISSGNYYFNSITMSNSSKMRFNFVDGQPVRLFIKNSVSLSNSSTFEYINGGINGGADLVYLEAGTGLTCSNSVQWRGFVYAPNGDVNFSNATSLTGAVYSTKRVMFANSTVATYVAPKYIDSGNSQNLLPLKFY